MGWFPFRSLEMERARWARTLAYALEVQAIVAGVALAAVLLVETGGPFSVGMLASATIVVASLSILAAYLESKREPLAESFALPAGLAAFATAMSLGLAGLWWMGPLLAVSSFAVGFALVERYLSRNESRHAPHD